MAEEFETEVPDETEKTDDLIELQLDDDSMIEVRVIDYIEIGGFTYLVVEEAGNELDAFILKETKVEKEESIFEAVSPEEFEWIAKLLMEESDEYDIF